MGKKPKAKSTGSGVASRQTAEKVQTRRLEWWKLIVPAIVALLAVLIPLLWNSLKPIPPQFAIANPILRPDSTVTLLAQNRAAERKKNLNIEFDGLLFAGAGILQTSSNPPLWQFTLQGHNLPDSLLHDGRHFLRAGFAGEALSEPLTLFLNSQPPMASVEVKQPPGKPNDRIFIGRAASRLPAPADTLTVDIAFNSGGKPVKIPVPVKRVTDESTGRTYFEFETTVQGLPKISPKDTRYAQPFFALRITDGAGNRFFQQESYAQFMAPGDKRFGATNIAAIELKRLPAEVPLQGKTALDKSGNLRLTFRVTPTASPLTHLANGQPAIILKVTALAGNIRQLEWTSLPDSLRAEQPVTTILRDEQPLAHTFADKFVDEQAPAKPEPTYRVEQMGRDGKVYGSNTVPEKRTFLSEENVRKMLKDNNLFDAHWNPSGTGIVHQYQEIVRDGVSLVLDNATGLVWQRYGSDPFITYEEAWSYVQKLNTNKFGGYSNWRFPTLKEAMALVEPEKNSFGLHLHIDSKFGQYPWIWTADCASDMGGPWLVNFIDGICFYQTFPSALFDNRNFSVRAVRSGQ
jgi:Protein of unknown function (DUF1566)